MRLTRRLRRLVAGEGAYSLIELVTVTVILSTILGALTTLFVQGSNAELDANRRFQAQLNAGLALDKLRRDVHCASAVTPTGSSASITLTIPSQCAGGVGQVSWCTVGSGSKYTLYRKAGATCDAAGTPYAEYVTIANVFNASAPVPTSLAKIRVDLPVNLDPSRAHETYELVDDLVLRNSLRA